LKSSAALQGVVITPDGLPAPGVFVAIVQGRSGAANVTLQRGSLRDYSSQVKTATTDETGRFQIPSPPEDALVVAAADPGFGSAPLAQVRAQGSLVLQPYGRIEGVMRIGGEPASGKELLFQLPGIITASSYMVTTDDQGRFTFDQVPPGKCAIVRRVMTTPKSWTYSHSTDVMVEPGKTTRVTLGNTGAVLRGTVRFETPPTDTQDVTISGRLSQPDLQTLPGLSPEEMNDLVQSPEWRSQVQNQKRYAALVGPDGSLVLDSIPPGNYTLSVTATKSGNPMHPIGTLIAQGQTTVTIPAEANPATPIDVGEIILEPVRKP
jgi:hypothetical protein